MVTGFLNEMARLELQELLEEARNAPEKAAVGKGDEFWVFMLASGDLFDTSTGSWHRFKED